MEMSDEFLGIIMLAFMLGVIFVGFPISFTLIFVALIFGYYSFGNIVFHLMVSQSFGFMQEEVLAAVPLFIFMGYMTEQAGLMERLFEAFRNMLAPLKGSLYLGVVLTATVFAMATGIVGAAVTVLGIMSAPIMIRCGYSPRLASGAIAAGGTLGILDSAERHADCNGAGPRRVSGQTLRRRLRAGIPAGIPLHHLSDHSLSDKPETRASRSQGGEDHGCKDSPERSFLRHGPIGSSDHRDLRKHPGRAGNADRSGFHGRRRIDSPGPWLSEAHLGEISNRCHRDSQTSSMVIFLGVASNVFGAVFARLGSADLMTRTLLAMQVSPFIMLLVLMALIFLLGWPFEWPAIIYLFLPILMPIVVAMKYDLVWFGTLVAVNLQTAFLSPPVAMSAYYLKAVVPEWELGTIYKGMMDFMVLQVIAIFILMVFPELATWFPSYLFD